MERAKALREKTAWITLVCTLVVYGGYFIAFARATAEGRSFSTMGGVALAVIVYVIFQVALMIVAAATAPRDAEAREDERERVIQVRAGSGAFHVLQLAAICAVPTVYVVDKWMLANAMFAALILAEVARNLFVITGYRREG